MNKSLQFLVNNTLHLNEMAECANKRLGQGNRYVVYPNDHIPPHFHILNDRNKTLYRVIIPSSMPDDFKSIRIFKDGNPVSNKLKKKILEVLKSEDEEGRTVYRKLVNSWNTYNVKTKPEAITSSFNYSTLANYDLI